MNAILVDSVRKYLLPFVFSSPMCLTNRRPPAPLNTKCFVEWWFTIERNIKETVPHLLDEGSFSRLLSGPQRDKAPAGGDGQAE